MRLLRFPEPIGLELTLTEACHSDKPIAPADDRDRNRQTEIDGLFARLDRPFRACLAGNGLSALPRAETISRAELVLQTLSSKIVTASCTHSVYRPLRMSAKAAGLLDEVHDRQTAWRTSPCLALPSCVRVRHAGSSRTMGVCSNRFRDVTAGHLCQDRLPGEGEPRSWSGGIL